MTMEEYVTHDNDSQMNATSLYFISMENSTAWTEHYIVHNGPTEGPFLQLVVHCLQVYIAPVIAVGGILSSLLTVLCLINAPHIEGRSYAAALMVTEMLQLIGLLHDWATEIGLDMHVITGWCHLTHFILHAAHFLTQWYLVSLILHCGIQCCWPQVKSSRLISLIIIYTMAIISLVVYFNLSLTVSLLYVGERPVCTIISKQTAFALKVSDVLSNVLLPLLIVIVMVFLMIVKIPCYVTNMEQPQKCSFRLFLILHVLFWIPFQGMQVYNTLIMLPSRIYFVPLTGFLWEQIFLYVYHFGMVFNVIVIVVSIRTYRSYVRRRLLLIFCKIEEIEYISRPVQTSLVDIRVECQSDDDDDV